MQCLRSFKNSVAEEPNTHVDSSAVGSPDKHIYPSFCSQPKQQLHLVFQWRWEGRQDGANLKKMIYIKDTCSYSFLFKLKQLKQLQSHNFADACNRWFYAQNYRDGGTEKNHRQMLFLVPKQPIYEAFWIIIYILQRRNLVQMRHTDRQISVQAFYCTVKCYLQLC